MLHALNPFFKVRRVEFTTRCADESCRCTRDVKSFYKVCNEKIYFGFCSSRFFHALEKEKDKLNNLLPSPLNKTISRQKMFAPVQVLFLHPLREQRKEETNECRRVIGEIQS
jgi:hypothetical protein